MELWKPATVLFVLVAAFLLLQTRQEGAQPASGPAALTTATATPPQTSAPYLENGTVISACPAVLDESKTFTLGDNLRANSSCITISANGAVLDCGGRSISGEGRGSGVYLDDVSNVTIRNCVIRRFHTGIYVSSGGHNTFINNILEENAEDGLKLTSGSNFNTMVGNIARRNNYTGIVVYAGRDNVASGNIADDNARYGIFFDSHSSGGAMRGNRAENNGEVNLYLTTSSNITIEGNIVSGGVRGIQLDASDGNVIRGNSISGAIYGISLYASSGNGVFNNTVIGGLRGIQLYADSRNNTVGGNAVRGSSDSGIYMEGSGNIVENNTLDGNDRDFVCSGC